jgi:hypothetical protein
LKQLVDGLPFQLSLHAANPVDQGPELIGIGSFVLDRGDESLASISKLGKLQFPIRR